MIVPSELHFGVGKHVFHYPRTNLVTLSMYYVLL